MVEPGDYLIENVGFSPDREPRLSLQHGNTLINFNPFGQTLTLRFDMSQRFCKGWYDMAVDVSSPCPGQVEIDTKYEQCPACQKRTGFNPAFYNATSVSKQQEARNQEPHTLYMAHFGDGVVKVGISHAARGNSRLLEQGARTALVLDTFPTALIARQYESKIAAMPGIVETVQTRKKIDLLAKPYDQNLGMKDLVETRTAIETNLGKKFSQNEPEHLDPYYFPARTPDLSDSYDTSDKAMISGLVSGMLGSFLVCRQQDSWPFLPLKKFVGYPVSLSYDETSMAIPARQISLF